MDIEKGDLFRVSRNDDYSIARGVEHTLIFRLMFYDRFELFVDMLMTGGSKDAFQFEKIFKGERIFARVPMWELQEKGEKIGHVPFNPGQLEYIHAKLPIRINRFNNIEWDSPVFDDKYRFNDFINKNTNAKWKEQRIEVNTLYLETIDDKDTWKKPTLLTADNDIFFTVSEILWKAGQAQGNVKTTKSGVGIYRSGSKGQIPTYYIGGYFDRAGFLEEFERRGISTSI